MREPPDPEIDAEELAWAAGFLDAEGCFSFTKAARYATVVVGQAERAPLDRFARTVGTGKVRGPFSTRSQKRPSVKDQYAFYAYGGRALRVSDLLWPFLAPRKRLQVTRMRDCVRQFNPQVSQHLQDLESGRQLTRREELSWAAGFFDGDGCFSYSGSIRGITVAVGQRDPEVLDRLREILGVGRVYGPYLRKPGGLGGKRFFQYRAHGFENTQGVAAMLWFKLGATKRRQAADVLAKRLRTCRRGHVLGLKRRGCPMCVAEAWARKRQVS